MGGDLPGVTITGVRDNERDQPTARSSIRNRRQVTLDISAQNTLVARIPGPGNDGIVDLFRHIAWGCAPHCGNPGDQDRQSNHRSCAPPSTESSSRHSHRPVLHDSSPGKQPPLSSPANPPRVKRKPPASTTCSTISLWNCIKGKEVTNKKSRSGGQPIGFFEEERDFLVALGNSKDDAKLRRNQKTLTNYVLTAHAGIYTNMLIQPRWRHCHLKSRHNHAKSRHRNKDIRREYQRGLSGSAECYRGRLPQRLPKSNGSRNSWQGVLCPRFALRLPARW